MRLHEKTINKIKSYLETVWITLVIIGVAVALSVLGDTVSSKFSLKIDISGREFYSLSDQTKQILNALESPLTIYVLSDKTTYSINSLYSQIYELIEIYGAYENIKIEYIDIYKNPNFSQKFPDTARLNEGSLIIEGSRRSLGIPLTSLHTYTSNNLDEAAIRSEFRAEEVITRAMVSVTRQTQPVVYFVNGHNQLVPEGFIGLLKNNDYQVKTINLLWEEIETGKLLIILSPASDFLVEETKKLDRFLSGGGDMLVMIGPESPNLPILAHFLEEWGIKYTGYGIFDPVRSASHPIQIAPILVPSEINQNISASGQSLVAPFSTSIEILWENRSQRKVTPVLVTSDKAYAKKYTSGKNFIESYEKEEKDIAGRFNIAVLAQNTDNSENISRILCIGSRNIVNDAFLETPNLLNNEFITNAIAYTNEQPETVTLRPKKMLSGHLTILGYNRKLIFILTVVIIPLGIIGLGLLIWFRRFKS